jgi:hypothetical protein
MVDRKRGVEGKGTEEVRGEEKEERRASKACRTITKVLTLVSLEERRKKAELEN